MKKELRFYQTTRGRTPLIQWLEKMKDKIGKAHIKRRISNLSIGYYGDYKYLKGNICELRIHYGSGYRVYFSEQGKTIILLLVAGTKGTQKKDIEMAKRYLQDFEERYND